MELAILMGFIAFIARYCYLLGRMDERKAIRDMKDRT